MCQNCDDLAADILVRKIADFLTAGGYGRVGALVLDEFSPLGTNGDKK